METIKLDLIPGKKMPSLHASQYDEGREHGIDLFENGVAHKLDGTETLTINERKGDDCICSLDIENTFTGSNHIVFASTEQMCAVRGNNLCELRIIKGGVDLGTLNFILEVEASPIEGGIQSESEINNLYTQIDARVDEDVEGKLDDYATKEWVGEECYDKTYIDNAFTGVNNSLNTKMDKANPTGTGSFSLNRKADSIVGENSVAMGTNTRATGTNTTALGNDTIAYGTNGVAMGNGTTARDENAVAMGMGTRALGKNQFVFGKYNSDNNYNNFVEIVGKGNVFVRSNARTLDWSGNEVLAGDLTYNGNKSLTSEVARLDGRIDALPEAMVFKGTLGVGGTIQTLPTASTSNEGYTYKVITDGTYAGQTAKVGDVFTSDGSTWVLIPSGDEDTDTWRAIKVNGVEKLGNGISSGSLDVVDTDNIEAEFDANGNKLKIKTKNIYTQSEVDTLIANAIDSVLPTDSVAKSAIANFETDYAKPIELKAYIEAVQASGTPTPSTPIPISGWSQVEITLADGDMQTNDSVTIALGDTYYGGYVTQDKDGHRRLVVTHSRIDLGTLNWEFRATSSVFRTVGLKVTSQRLICSSYATQYPYFNWTDMSDLTIQSNYADTIIKDTNYTDAALFKQSLNGVYAVYPLAEPIVIDLPDGEPINALIGTNNLFADSGDMECSFKCGVAMYVDNHSGGGNRSVNLAKSVEEEAKEEEPKIDEPITRQER